MVSTDDLEIADIAIEFGAKVPFIRSEVNASDFATTFDVINEVIAQYEKNNQKFKNICCLYPCAPFVTKKYLKFAYSELITKEFDVVFPILTYSFPIQRALTYKEGRIKMIHKKNLKVRSQDLEKSYHDAGQFYWCNTEALLKNKLLLTENTGGIIISELEAQDIDTEIDWKLAELKYKLFK